MGNFGRPVYNNDVDLVHGYLLTYVSTSRLANMPEHNIMQHPSYHEQVDSYWADQRDITKFISEMNMIDWQFVLNETDTQLTYT